MCLRIPKKTKGRIPFNITMLLLAVYTRESSQHDIEIPQYPGLSHYSKEIIKLAS